MVAVAKAKYIRISPYKVRRIANEIKNKNVTDVEAYLTCMTNKSADILKKLVHSARSNYLNTNSSASEESLVVSNVLVDGGPIMKRYHPISKGRASKILKRSCHIMVEVTDAEGDK